MDGETIEYGNPIIEAHPIPSAVIGSKIKYSFLIKGRVIIPKPVRNKLIFVKRLRL